jgi:hypothetical protein
VANEVVTTVQAAAASYNLTDLPTVKDELSIDATDTTSDAFLGRGITQTSEAMAQYCNRVFVVEALTDTFYFNWRSPRRRDFKESDDAIQLTRWPVAAVLSVTITDAPGDTPTALVAGVDYVLDAKNGQLIKLDPTDEVLSRWQDVTVVVSYLAGYGGAPTETYTIPGSPYTQAVSQSAAFSVDAGVVYTATGLPLTKIASGTPAAGQYSVNTTNGTYAFAAADAGKQVSITYGFNAIPGDLVDAVLRMVTQRFKARGRDPMLMESEQPGPQGRQRFWVSNNATGSLPPEITGLLDGTYRVPVAS